MKKYTKIILILLAFTSISACAQLHPKQKEILVDIKNNTSNYKGKNLSELLAQSPDMKMVNIFKNIPESGVTTFIIGFSKQKEYKEQFEKKLRPSNISVYVTSDQSNPVEIPDTVFSEDIQMKDAIKKYGNLKIIAVYLVTP
ncbi:hypothetical protein ACH34E_16065 [Elizabethkingia anophelis]|nr:hypothetical protein [Elizabethkingia anophelis]MCT3803355.1 hypothetical protein [Elizabethkingia anophelis]MCT4060257.1 hypothetical protein [Elizabethkingia anophelis]MCT4070948.1 hypothetical protein [Elizabethkingia anophelis]